MTRSIPALAALGVLLAASGCSSGPKPTADLAQAHTLVDQAEQSGAAQFASDDLVRARNKLQQADQDARNKPEASMQLAQEATVDARLAIARTAALKAQQAMRDVNAGTQTLRNETDRAQSQSDTTMPSTTAPSVPH
jgi:Domain of unknown function (DUF4398)